MQKVINALALISFAVSAGVVGAGAYVYLNKDALIEKAKEKAAEVIGSQLGSALVSGPALDPVAGMDEAGAIDLPVIPF